MKQRLSVEDLRGLAAALVEKALSAGADEAEVHIGDGSEFGVDVRLGRIENLVEAGSRGLGLRVILDKKTAYAASSDLSEEALDGLIRRAVQRARLASHDDFAGLPDKTEKPPAVGPLHLFDPDLEAVDARKKIELAILTERLALENKRITNSQGASVGTSQGVVILANSKGFLEDFRHSHCSLSVGLQAGGTDERVEDFWYSARSHWKELDPPEKVARTAVARTVRQLNPRKIRTQQAPVIFEPLMTSWLMGLLFSCVSGTAVYQKTTFLAERLGQEVGSGLVTVLDDGLLPRRPGTRPFDSEGVPCRRTTVLDKGLLKNFLCNTYAARKLGLPSTGNASGGGVGPNNFYLQPGPLKPADIIASTERGLLLVKTIGHGLNPVTGDISRGAFGLWVEKGEVIHPVSEITVSGNLGRMLRDLEAVADDLDLDMGVTGPTIRVREMTVAGR
jgi:PmbA protein